MINAAMPSLFTSLEARGAVMRDASHGAVVQSLMWPGRRLCAAVIGQSARVIAQRSAAQDASGRQAWHDLAHRGRRVLTVEKEDIGPAHPFSGEKLSPVLTAYGARDFDDAAAIVERSYCCEGARHPVGWNSQLAGGTLRLGLTLPVSSRIVNQPHALSTGGNFNNALPWPANLAANAGAISAKHGLTRANRVMAVLPLHHINAFAVTLLAPLAQGAAWQCHHACRLATSGRRPHRRAAPASTWCPR